MNISSINTNYSFGRVSTEAAKHALANAERAEANGVQGEVDKVKSLICKGYQADAYEVGFDENQHAYCVYRNSYIPKTDAPFEFDGRIGVNNFETAVDYTLLLEKNLGKNIEECTKNLNKEHAVALYTQPQQLSGKYITCG